MAIDDVSRDLDGGGPYCSAPRSGCPAKVGRRSEERPTLPSGGGNGVGAIRQRDSIRVASLSLPRSSLGETPSDAKEQVHSNSDAHWCQKVTFEARIFKNNLNGRTNSASSKPHFWSRCSSNIGHGGSDGLHAYVHSLDEAVTDTKSFIGKVVAENPGLPCFCFGHSTGAAIILKAVLDPKIEACIAGVVVTSPAVGVQPSHPIFTVLAPVISFLFPSYQLSVANKAGMPVCRDPNALVAKYSDPLVYTGSIRVRTGYEILRIAAYLQKNLKRLRAPFLVLHGSSDTTTDPQASKRLYEEASSADKSIKLLDGLLHDLLFEPERDEIVAGIVDWLNCRI
ncbi:acylglycerol lipase [Sarracenia purpurea var. burkii]